MNFTCELVASKPDEVIIMRLKADKPGVGVVGGTKFLALLGAKTVGGNISATDDGLKITGANEATLIVPAGTDMFGKNFSTSVRQRLDAALEKPFDKVRGAALLWQGNSRLLAASFRHGRQPLPLCRQTFPRRFRR